ncbi:MAG: AAA family ATPase, partial [Proteobacteria bacterium]|nr:AAA family ATPase [Pseudomonadota bacterium]
MKEGLPNIEKIEVKKSKDGHTQFHIYYQGNYTATNTGLSEGTLSFLALTILPYLNNLPPIIFLEKPENDMSPRVIQLILQSLSSAYESQV